MTTVSADSFFGGSVPKKPVPVVGMDSQLLEPTTPEQATAPNLFKKIAADANGGVLPWQKLAKEGAVPEGIAQIKKGFNDTTEAVQTAPTFKEGAQALGKGALNEAAGALRVLFSPVEAGASGAAKLPVIKQVVGAIKQYITDPASNALSDMPALQKFVDQNPDAEEVTGNLIAVLSTFLGGGKGADAAAVASDAASAIGSAGSKIAAAPAALEQSVIQAGKDAVAKVVPQTAKENVARVLTNTGKKSLTDAATNASVTKATEALDIIRQNADNIKVKDLDGVEKPFVPSKATFIELPQALKQTKDAIYKRYTDMAKAAGDAGLEIVKKDFNELRASLKKYTGKGNTKAFVNKANDLLDTLDSYGNTATPEELQGLIEKVNKDVNPNSDAAGAQVANEFSQTLRNKLDAKLEASGNPEYQATRDQYAKLKSVEADVLARYKQAMRKAGVKPDIIDGIISLDALQNIVTGNPAGLARTAGAIAIKKLTKFLGDPEVNLQRAFRILGEEADSAATKAVDVPPPVVETPIQAEKPLTPPKGRKAGTLQKEMAARKKAGEK